MSRNLVEKGSLSGPLLIHNRTPARAKEFSDSLQTVVVESISNGIAQADIIFTCVSNDEAVQELYGTMLNGDMKGKLFIECSTIHPDTTEAVATLTLAHGAEFIAAPVFGAPAMAEAGQLVAALAGPPTSIAKARPWFKGVMARAEIDLTNQPYRKATELKVLGNTFILNMVEQLAEAHVVAEKSGLGTEALHQFVDAVFGAPYTAYSTRMLTGDYHKRDKPLFAVNLAKKDAQHAMSISQAAGAKLSNVEIGQAHLAKVEEYQGDGGDIASIYGAARVDAGLSFEN